MNRFFHTAQVTLLGKLHDLYSSLYTERVVKASGFQEALHITQIRKQEVYTEFQWGNYLESSCLEERYWDGRIICPIASLSVFTGLKHLVLILKN
jgi:hypothetical protein